MSVYNVIWADDDIDNLFDNQTQKDFADKNICVIATARNGYELEKTLSENKNVVDAVIVDANFSESEVVVDNERDTSGFSYALSLFRHQYKKTIPFFLYSGRSEELLKSKYQDSKSFEIDFPRKKRWFKKSIEEDEFLEMLDEICKVIEEQNTPEFQIRNKFSQELEAASLLPGAKEALMDGLMFEYSHADTSTSELYFNPLRMIFEKIRDGLVNKKYIPKLSSLNSIPRFLDMEEIEVFQMNKRIMHKTLIYSLEYFLCITQDGSHDTDDLRLKVIDYVRERKNANLFKSALFIIMDILLWYKELLESDIDKSTLWTGNFEAEGKVCAKSSKNKLKYILNGKYLIQDNGNLQDGTEIIVKVSEENQYKFDEVTRYVSKRNYFIK